MSSILTIRSLSFGYPGREPLFEPFDLDLDLTRIAWLRGPNGSGKTTFCRLLAGLQTGYGGSVKIDALNLVGMSAEELVSRICYLKQDPRGNIVAATPNEDLENRQTRFRGRDSEELLRLRNLALAAFGLERYTNTPVWALSHGETKRVGLAALSLNDPLYWVLDEPFTGLDVHWHEVLLDIIEKRRSSGRGMLIVSHLDFRKSGEDALIVGSRKIARG